MLKLSTPARTLGLRVGVFAVLAAAAGYAVVQIYDEAYLEGSRVGVSSQLLQQATAGLEGKARDALTPEERHRLDAGLEQALRVADASEFALSWLQVFSKPGASPEFDARVQQARCEAAKSQSMWMWLHKMGVKTAFTGPAKFELPPC